MAAGRPPKITKEWADMQAIELADRLNNGESIAEVCDEFVILRQEARHRLLEGRDILVFSKPKELMEKPSVQFGLTTYI